MQPLTRKDLWPLKHYDGVRDEFRKAVIAAKQDRRVAVGPFMTFVFENRLTVKFQVQEVLRVERIDSPEAIEEELEGFNGMLPGPGELSATLLIELTGSDSEVKEQLARSLGSTSSEQPFSARRHKQCKRRPATPLRVTTKRYTTGSARD